VTQRQKQPVKRVVINNALWFAASFALAFFVWVIATLQTDPIVEQRFRASIPVQIEIDTGMTVVEQQTSTVTVTVRAQESVQEELTSEDIIVRADLRGLEPGVHTIELESELARRGVLDTQPKQITVTLEELTSQQITIQPFIAADNDVPATFVRETPVLSETQATVSGIASRVREVSVVRAPVDLTGQLNSLETEVRLFPIDVNGRVVSDVTIEPPVVDVFVEIRRREDIQEVSVSPNIDPETLPEGYTVTFSYTPQTLFLVGTATQLESVPNPLSTELIDLTGRTEDFEATASVILPEGVTALVLGEQTVTIFFEISAQTTTRQFESIQVEFIGLDDQQLIAEPALDEVVVLVTGPEPLVRDLTPASIRVVIDISGLESGTYDLTPQALISQVQIDPQGISVNPDTITVTISSLTEPEATEEPQG
jgi:YbbR domain-containing protein